MNVLPHVHWTQHSTLTHNATFMAVTHSCRCGAVRSTITEDGVTVRHDWESSTPGLSFRAAAWWYGWRITAAIICLTWLAAAAIPPANAGRRQDTVCPPGYLPREVRIDHQRLEPDPDASLSPVVVPNPWPEDMPPTAAPDRRYLVALACVRPLTSTEINQPPYARKATP